MTSSLKDFRAQYPQYNNRTDEELADALYRKFYSSRMSWEDYRSKSGLPSLVANDPTFPETVDNKLLSASAKNPLNAKSSALTALSTQTPSDEPDGIFPEWAEAASGTVTNALKLAAERGSSLIGHAIAGVIGKPGEYLGEKLGFGTIVYGTDWGEGDPADGKFRVRYMDAEEYGEFTKENTVTSLLSETVPEALQSQDFGGEARHTTQRIKDAYSRGEVGGTMGAVLGFGIEQGIQSIPDMISVMSAAGLVGYVGARADEIGAERARNKGLEQATIVENVEALPAALGSALLERIGAKAVGAAFGTKAAEQVGAEAMQSGLKRVAKGAGTAAAKEGTTEAFQEGVIEYLGEKLGTDSPLSWDDAVERGFFGALGGATFGGVAGAALGTAGELAPQQKMTAQEKPATADPEIVPDTDFDEQGNVVAAVAPDGEGLALPSPESEVNGAPSIDPRMQDPKHRIQVAGLASNFTGDAVPWIHRTVDKALTGEQLTEGESRIITAMLNQVTTEEDVTADTLLEVEPEIQVELPLIDAQTGVGNSLSLAKSLGEYVLPETPTLLTDSTPEPATGFTRLYRGEHRDQDRDVFITDDIDDGKVGGWFTEDLGYADYYRETQAVRRGGARIVFVDVPTDRLSEFRPSEDLQSREIRQREAAYFIPEYRREQVIEPASQNAVATVDLDGLRPINKTLGTGAGDGAIKAVAAALRGPGVEVHHTEADQFVVTGDNEGAVAEAADRASQTLARQVVESSRGKVVGMRVSKGVGPTLEAAQKAKDQDKKSRVQSGERNPSGVPPRGTVLNSKRPPQYAEGNRYVGMLDGHTGSMPINPQKGYQLGNGRTVVIPEKPVNRASIMALLQRRLGNKIYQGRVKGKTKLGFYRVGQGEIRIKRANDLEVTAHEVSHWLDDRHPWIGKLYRNFQNEMRGVSYDAQKLHEGYAEFMRLWMTQEHEAREAAPGFYDAWMESLSKHKGLEKVLYELQEGMHAWYLQGARKRLEDKIGDRQTTIMDRARESMNRVGDRVLMNLFDGLRPFKEIERQIRGNQGRAQFSGYASLRLARGGHGVMQGILKRGTVNWNEQGDMEFTGKGLEDVFAPVSDRMTEMQMYMVARRAQELAVQGRENLIRDDEIREGLRLGELNPDFETVFDEFQAFNSRMLDFAQRSGVLSGTTRLAIEEANKNYVPFNRIVESATGQRTKRGAAGSPFIRLKGGSQNINDVFENIVGNTANLVQMSLVNVGKRNFYRMIDASDDQTAGLYAVPIQKDSKPTNIEQSQVIKAVVEGLGLDMRSWRRMEAMPTSKADQELVDLVHRMTDGMGDFVTFFQNGMDPTGNVDFYLENGNKKFYEIGDPLLMDAINHMGPKVHNLALSMLGGFANILRKGVTLTPTFQAKNFIRDTMNAFTLSKGEIVPIAGATKALVERIYNDHHYWEMMINSGGFANAVQADGISQDRVVDGVSRKLDKADGFLGAFEMANRIAEFKSLRAKGWAARDAALAGREISTDFAMRGSSEIIRWLTYSIPFLNARMQGLYRIGRELTSLEEGKLQFAGSQVFSYGLRSFIALTLPSLALYALNKDDERYQDLEDWIKDLSWFISTGEGEDDYVLMPKPFETGMLFGTLPERMVEYWYKNDKKELADSMLWMVLETFNFQHIPQAFKTWDDLAKNRNFTGAPIIPDWMQDVEPMEQFKFYTSDAMIALGRKLNVSPIKAEYIVRGHFGTLGTWALGLSDMLVGDINNDEEDPTKGVKDNFLLAPFVNQGPLKRTDSEQDLYEMIRETRVVANTVRLMSKRSPDRLEEYADNPRKAVLLGLNEALAGWAKEVRELKNGQQLIRQDGSLSGDDKRDQIDELQRAINAISREARSAINPENVEQLIDEEAAK